MSCQGSSCYLTSEETRIRRLWDFLTAPCTTGRGTVFSGPGVPAVPQTLGRGQWQAGASGAEEPGGSSDPQLRGARRRQCDRGSWPSPCTLPPAPSQHCWTPRLSPQRTERGPGTELSARRSVNAREVGQLWAGAAEGWRVSSTVSWQDAVDPGENRRPRRGQSHRMAQASALSPHEEGCPPERSLACRASENGPLWWLSLSHRDAGIPIRVLSLSSQVNVGTVAPHPVP